MKTIKDFSTSKPRLVTNILLAYLFGIGIRVISKNGQGILVGVRYAKGIITYLIFLDKREIYVRYNFKRFMQTIFGAFNINKRLYCVLHIEFGRTMYPHYSSDILKK